MELLEAKAPNTEIAVLMVDVDNFKVLNDTYGHQFGDYCLQSVAKCIQDSIRADVGKVGRYGGEEFLVVITDPTKSSVQRTAEEIRKNIAKLTLMHEDKERVKITATIGWHFSAQAESVSSMINLADKALYLGKNLGRNKVVSSSDL
jgi:diguanylate cyclase